MLVPGKGYRFEPGRRFSFLQESLHPNVTLNITYWGGGACMSVKSVQFAVATHIMAALGVYPGGQVGSATLADSVNANPSFVRKSLSKLSKAGLVVTTRGKSGASVLARPAGRITLLDIYRASGEPATFAMHSYPVEKRCPVSCNLKECMAAVLSQTQKSFEKSLAKITLADLIKQIPAKRRGFFCDFNCADK